MRFCVRALVIAASALAATAAADAATFCVKDAQELEAALTLAQANGEDDVIQVQAGVFTPSAASFTYQSDEAHSLTIAGGYFTLPENAACAFQLSGADYTRIDGAGTKAPLYIDVTAAESSVIVSNLTVQNAVSVASVPPLRLVGAGSVALENVVVRARQVDSHAAQVGSTNGHVQVRNCAFVDNSSMASLASAVLVSANAGLTPAVVFNNNTVAANVGMAGALFTGSGDTTIANNVLWDNGGTDLIADGSGSNDLSNNDYGTRTGTSTTDINALHVDPKFLAPGDFRLRTDSLLRDSGDNNALGGIGSSDAGGGERVVFGTVDIGAYEVPDRIFQDGFEPSASE
jgi:hypothetical protein